MKCFLFFLFLIFLNLIRFCSRWLFIFAHPSQLDWSFRESHISRVFWWISILSQLDENSCIHFSLSLSLSLCVCLSLSLVEVFSSLIAFSFLLTIWCFLKILSFLDGFPFYLALMNSLFWSWWIFLFWTSHIVFIEDLTKWCWIHKVNTSLSWDLSIHT